MNFVWLKFPPCFGCRYGAHVLVTKYTNEDEGRIFEGSVQLSGVEFFNGGQYQTVRHAFNFQGGNGSTSFVKSCSFHSNQNTAIYLKQANSITIHGE